MACNLLGGEKRRFLPLAEWWRCVRGVIELNGGVGMKMDVQKVEVGLVTYHLI